jgi:hypothetical protein
MRSLIETIEAKDEQIKQLQQGFMPQLEEALKDKEYYREMVKQLQQELLVLKAVQKDDTDCEDECMELKVKLEIANKALASALDNLYCMLPCGSAKDTQYGHIAVDTIERALEKIGQEGDKQDVE